MRALSIQYDCIRVAGQQSIVADMITAFADTVAFWRRRAQQRRVMAAVEARMLSDIGMQRVQHEVVTTFWRV
ncbi:MAG: DUF1127 domain-containing protein [Alphaproteobacteria bacterium]